MSIDTVHVCDYSVMNTTRLSGLKGGIKTKGAHLLSSKADTPLATVYQAQ